MPTDPAPPLVVLMAHPDDEFALFPSLRAAAPERDLILAYLTDGGWGGQDNAVRNSESVRVLAGLGVGSTQLHFLGKDWSVPDGGLHLRLDDVVAGLKRLLGHLPADTEMWVPAWEGGHQDHDACHLAGLALSAAIGASLWQFSLYNGAGLRGPFFKVLSPLRANGPEQVVATTAAERLHYARLCLSYKSQFKSFVGLWPFYLWRMRRSDAFVRQPVDPVRTASRPHDGALLYERRGGPSWEAFAAATSAFRHVPGC